MCSTNLKPDFSVVIPTFNRKHLLSRSVKSVLNQTFQNFELIIVDDGSTDNTEELVKEFNDNRIKYIRHSENKGVSTARNTGIKNANGTLIAFLDSDDEYLPAFLEETRNYLFHTSEEYGFSWTGTIKIKRADDMDITEEIIKKAIWKPGYVDRVEAYNRCLEWDPRWGTGHGFTAKAFVFSKIGLFDESLKAREDIDILLRLMKEFKYKVIPKYLINIYIQEKQDRVDGNDIEKATAYKIIMQKHFNTIKNNKKSYVFFNSLIARYYMNSKYYGKSFYYLMKGARKNLFNLTIINLFIRLLYLMVAGNFLTKIIFKHK